MAACLCEQAAVDDYWQIPESLLRWKRQCSISPIHKSWTVEPLTFQYLWRCSVLMLVNNSLIQWWKTSNQST